MDTVIGKRAPARAAAAAARRFLASAALLLAAGVAAAHDVEGAPTGWDARWSFDPWVIASLIASLGAYALGLARLWRHAGVGRGVRRGRAAAFVAGWAVLVLALVSPLDGLGGHLFSAHMVQHELLMVVAAPLLVIGHPLAVWAWALPFSARRKVGALFRHPAWRRPWQLLTAPLSAWLVHALALWLWHVPVWFDAALVDDTVHTLQHASFLFSALLFWWSALGPIDRASRGIALVSLFTTMLHSGALGALLVLSPVPWYPRYADAAAALGWNALDDQHLGGLVMWAPAALAYVIAGLVLAAPWLHGRPATVTAAARPPSLGGG